MKRRPGDDDDLGSGASGDSKLVRWLSGFFAKDPRFGVWLAVGLGLVLLVGLIIAHIAQG